MKKIITIVILTFILLFLLTKQNKIYENYENININLGNVLSDYYYKYVFSILTKKDFNYSNNNIFAKKHNFMSKFPKIIKWNKLLYNTFTENNISISDIINIESESFWFIDNYNIQQIHNIMKPIMNKIFDDTFTHLNLKKEIKYPIIHFRCADTPYILHPQYYFQRYKYFDKAIKELENKIGKIKDITLLTCVDHLSKNKDKNACKIYSIIIKEYLNNYNVHIKCNTNVDDFVSMFYAPAVISTISSFSFMAGFFGNGIYIQPNMMTDDNEVCLDCDNTYKGYNIPHNKVNDYHNVDEVYKLLIS